MPSITRKTTSPSSINKMAFSLSARAQQVAVAIIPVLLAAPTLIAGDATKLPGLVLMAGILGGFLLFRAYEVPSVFTTAYAAAMGLYSAFILVTVISIARGPSYLIEPTAKAGFSAALILYSVFVALLFASPKNPTSVVVARMRALLLAIPVFVAVNLLALAVFGLPEWVPDYPLTIRNTNELLASLGFSSKRLGATHAISGSNAISILAGASLVGLACLLKLTRGLPRLVYALLGLTSFIALIMSESRIAIFGVIVAVSAFYFAGQKLLRIANYLALTIAVISAPALTFAFNLLDGTSLGRSLIRQADTQSLGTGTGRSYVWDAAMAELSNPSASHAFGYGLYSGQTRGIADKFAFIFEDNSVPTFHNTALQWVLDTGYVGLALFIALQIVSIAALNRVRGSYPKALLCLLLFAYIASFTDAAITLYVFEMFLLVLGINLAALSLLNRPGKRR